MPELLRGSLGVCMGRQSVRRLRPAWATLRAAIVGGIAMVALVLLTTNAHGQSHGDEKLSLGLLIGVLQPQTTFDDGSSFQNGGLFGVSMTGWAGRFVGFRAGLSRGKTDGHNDNDPWSAIAVQDPTVWLYNGEVVVRYPLGGESLSWFPYISGGIGAKTYLWEAKYDGDTVSAYTMAGGLELRPSALGPVGLVLESRYTRSEFNLFGHGKHYDAYQRGVTFGERFFNYDASVMGGVSIRF